MARKSKRVTLASSAVRTASGVGDAVSTSGFKGGTFQLVVTNAATQSGDTLNVYVQRLLADGTSYDDVVAFTQVLGDGADSLKFVADVIFDSQASDERAARDGTLTAGSVSAVPLTDAIRAKWVVVDASTDDATFTFSVTGILF